MREELGSSEDQSERQKREEIAQVGLNFKLMTQYTSFVAIDDVVFTGTEDPAKVEVPA
jgi:hypothetical protein